MNTEGTPSPIPTASSTGPAPLVFSLRDVGKKKDDPQWTLTILPTHLALAEAPGAQPYVILREQMMKTVVFMGGMRLLSVQQPRKVNLQLTPAGAKALEEWIGKPFLASFYMNRRYKVVLPWAILWIIGSVMTLLPNPRSEMGPHIDVTAFVLGVILLGAWALAKRRPHPALFLVDAIWFAWVAIRLILNVFAHDRSKLFLILAALLVWASVTGFKHFIHFRGTRMAPVPS